jgi:hypothetical protein
MGSKQRERKKKTSRIRQLKQSFCQFPSGRVFSPFCFFQRAINQFPSFSAENSRSGIPETQYSGTIFQKSR